jgi:glycosyltransferase involved in cell wall biosynthesis
MACAKPILAVNLKGIAEVIQDGKTGYLFTSEHPDIFKEKLARLANAPNESKQIGSAALKESFTISATETNAQAVCQRLRDTL